jgi:hypothetical protein
MLTKVRFFYDASRDIRAIEVPLEMADPKYPTNAELDKAVAQVPADMLAKLDRDPLTDWYEFSIQALMGEFWDKDYSK